MCSNKAKSLSRSHLLGSTWSSTADRSLYDRESYREQMAPHTFESLSRYFDVIRRSVCECALLLQLELPSSHELTLRAGPFWLHTTHLRSHPHVNMWEFFIVSEADTKFAICNTILTVFAQVRWRSFSQSHSRTVVSPSITQRCFDTEWIHVFESSESMI